MQKRNYCYSLLLFEAKMIPKKKVGKNFLKQKSKIMLNFVKWISIFFNRRNIFYQQKGFWRFGTFLKCFNIYVSISFCFIMCGPPIWIINSLNAQINLECLTSIMMFFWSFYMWKLLCCFFFLWLSLISRWRRVFIFIE